MLGFMYVIVHVNDSNKPSMLMHFLYCIQIHTKLIYTSMVSQCRSDIGILVIVNQVNTVSFPVHIILREMDNKKQKRGKKRNLIVS